LYHLKILPPYLTKNASPNTRKIERDVAGIDLKKVPQGAPPVTSPETIRA
jgi:hypothetical protein